MGGEKQTSFRPDQSLKQDTGLKKQFMSSIVKTSGSQSEGENVRGSGYARRGRMDGKEKEGARM